MSRTDVHRPVWVIELDPFCRNWVKDFHDHEAGFCDLEQYLLTRNWAATKCHRQIWTGAPNLCGCQLCTCQFGRKYNRRQERAAWRGIRQQLLKTAAEDYEDVDVPPIDGGKW